MDVTLPLSILCDLFSLFSAQHFRFLTQFVHSIGLGYRGVTANFTYSWKPVNNTNFAVCIVVASNELDAKVKPVYLEFVLKFVSEISHGFENLL